MVLGVYRKEIETLVASAAGEARVKRLLALAFRGLDAKD